MPTDTPSTMLTTVRNEAHPTCFVCSPQCKEGLCLEFALTEDNCVEAHFDCEKKYEGYQGMLHGGVISSILDGAMTNCLFANGRCGITGELKVRFRHPVTIGQSCLIRAWIERASGPFHLMKSELIQDQRIKAKATGKFVEQVHHYQ